jgi:hypothetical protein
MVTLITFIRDLIVSVVILQATYGLLRFVARCVPRLVCSIGFGERAQWSGIGCAAAWDAAAVTSGNRYLCNASQRCSVCV